MFLQNFSGNNFSLSGAQDNTSGLSNRGGIADLPLLITLLAICQNSWESSFWKVMESFVLLAYASLAASSTLLRQLLACLNFTLESENFSLWYSLFFSYIISIAKTALIRSMEFLWTIHEWYDPTIHEILEQQYFIIHKSIT